MFTRAIHNTKLIRPRVGSDSCGIPLKPTWSVNQLLSSYPSPSISPDKFNRLHQLSALLPPAQRTPEYNTTKKELDELIRLVEAVKLVDIEVSADGSIPDGRIWAEDARIPLTDHGVEDEIRGTELLPHANKVVEDMYVVETERER